MTMILDRATTSDAASSDGTATEPQAAHAIDPARIDELVRANLALVGHLVREVLNRVPAHVNRDDLTSAGMYALTLSARSFDAALRRARSPASPPSGSAARSPTNCARWTGPAGPCAARPAN